MSIAPLPADEVARLAALREMEVLDSEPDPEFDSLVRAASLVCGAPICLISLIDADRQWFKANVGLTGVAETSRDLAFCAHAILGDDIFEVPDARRDARFADNPLVTGDPKIRFYAGAPVRLADGHVIGTLCVIDRVPRGLSEIQLEILRNLAAAAAGAFDHLRDRRRRLQSEQELRASEQRLRRVYESTPAMLHLTDEAGRILDVSTMWLTNTGYARDEVIGRPVADFLTPDSVLRRAAALPALHETGHCEDVELQMVFKNGDVHDVQVSVMIHRDPREGPVRSIGVIKDVTRKRRIERKLIDERRRLSNIIDSTNVGTWEWNVRTDEFRANDRFSDILGLSPSETADLSIRFAQDRVHPADLAASRERLTRHLAGALDHYEAEVRMRRQDGRWVWVVTRGVVMDRGPDGGPEWMFGTLTDITARKLQEEALRKSEGFLDRTGRLAGVGGWECDLVTREVAWSAETYRIHRVETGFRPDLDSALGFFPPEAQTALRTAMERSFANGSPYDLELPLDRADGTRIWVHIIGTVIRDGDGRPISLAGAIQDVTARVDERRALELAHERLVMAADAGRIGVYDWDIVNDEMTWDSWLRQLYGIDNLESASAASEVWRRRLHPDDLAAAEAALWDAVEGRRPYDTEFRTIGENGAQRTIRAAGRVVRDQDGRAVRMVGVNWDVTEARRLAADLAEQHELLRVTLQSIGDGVITADAQGHVTWLNPVAERMTGWSSAEALGRPLAQVFHILLESTRELAENPALACLKQEKIVGLAGGTILVSRDGAEYGIEDSTAPICNDRGETLGVVLVFHDVTEQRRLSGELSHRASHDALTGLVNRAEFEVRLRRLLHRAASDGSMNTLLYIDLDQFKLVNDTCGHAVGDQLLVQVSRLLGEIVRGSDTLARLGGDEFAIILEHCDEAPAMRLAQRICGRMDDFRFTHDDRRFRIGASIGLVPVDDRWSGTAAIIQAADASCYAAKEAGRNRVHAWFETDGAMRARHGEMQWATRLEQALDEDRFVLFAQRIHPLRGDVEGVHAEILLRLTAEDGALTAPGAFLPAAERFHLASRIDRWVLRNVLRWMDAAASLESVRTLSVNLSGQSVGDRAFHRWAMEQLAQAGPTICGKLCVEITETAAVTNLADATLFIERMHELQVRVALDDFGAGASSFGYLKNMPVDVLKIDGQFIRNVVTDRLDEAAVRCFAQVAKVVDVRTVAEFVDQPAVLKRLQQLGIDFAQGYLLHRPAPIDELLMALDPAPAASRVA
jgi:diguanylate cyclase (GGDEF)-like protein/PAS domain S-box-containing protein